MSDTDINGNKGNNGSTLHPSGKSDKGHNPFPSPSSNPKHILVLVSIFLLGVLSTASLLTYGKRYFVRWEFDKTFLHTNRTELSVDEIARPDKQFIEMIMPHQRGALELANLAASRTQNRAIKDLAQRIKQTQNSRINELKNLYQRDYRGSQLPSWSGASTTTPIATQLATVTSSAEFDRQFIIHMIQQDQMMIKLASMVVDNAQNQEIRAFAQNIIRTQNDEINELLTLLQQ